MVTIGKQRKMTKNRYPEPNQNLDFAKLEEDVLRFWQSQSFDLRIPHGAGNCVGCFMKGARQLIDVFASDPDAAERWVARERRIGATVRSNRPPYAVLADYARKQLRMFEPSTEAESSLPCACGD